MNKKGIINDPHFTIGNILEVILIITIISLGIYYFGGYIIGLLK